MTIKAFGTISELCDVDNS